MSDSFISVKIDDSRAREAFLRFPAAFERIVDPFLSDGAYKVSRIARSLAPKAFSKLINAIDVRKVGPLHYEVTHGTNYGDAVETGAPGPMEKRPGGANGLDEWIRQLTNESDPRKLKGLSFAIAHSLQKTGIRAQPYMAPAAAQGQSIVTALVAAGAAQAVREIFG
jgi:hypothetical protein